MKMRGWVKNRLIFVYRHEAHFRLIDSNLCVSSADLI